MLKGELQNQILAILFANQDPVSIQDLILTFPEETPKRLEELLAEVAQNFNSFQEAMEIRQLGGGYRISTRPENHEVIRRFLKTKPSAKLSPAALETLAVIAYKQPITLPEIMEIRGVKGTSTIKTLVEKKLIEIRGRKKVVGKPILYGTTVDFLIHFGLDDLSDLPSLEEFEELYEAEMGGGLPSEDSEKDPPGGELPFSESN
ncbi:MAG: SMC-Scp complex subunit ScpB [Acidobacteriota bacterium]|nr:MAG: SMC-Scp complex subunit ScpB [Acidobacteriota bacterium]